MNGAPDLFGVGLVRRGKGPDSTSRLSCCARWRLGLGWGYESFAFAFEPGEERGGSSS